MSSPAYRHKPCTFKEKHVEVELLVRNPIGSAPRVQRDSVKRCLEKTEECTSEYECVHAVGAGGNDPFKTDDTD